MVLYVPMEENDKMFHQKQDLLGVLLMNWHFQRDHRIYFRNFRYLFRILVLIHVRITSMHREMRHVICISFEIDMVEHELNQIERFHQRVHWEFHRELFVIQRIFDHDMQHLRPNRIFIEETKEGRIYFSTVEFIQ